MHQHLLAILFLICASCGQSRKNDNAMNAADSSTSATTSKVDTTVINKMANTENLNETIDSLPDSLSKFIPAGYSAINISVGDANLDGLTDKILVLKNSNEETSSDYTADKPAKRPLLLLLGQPDGSYKLTARNDNAVYCIDCGGVFGDPFTGTTIKDGYFSIEHGIAGGAHWQQVTTFQFDKAKQKWFLYKDHFTSYKLNDSDDPNAEALIVETDKLETVKDFGVVPFEQFDIYDQK